MLIKTILSSIFGLSLFCMPVHAALQYSDWKSSGDQGALVDTETGVEWLRLSHTAGRSMSEVAQLLSSTYLGWRFPTAAEVEQMMDNYYTYTINPGSTLHSWNINVLPVRQWIDYFSVVNSTVNSGSNMAQSYGLYYSEAPGKIQMSGAYHRHSWTSKNVHSYVSTIYEDYNSPDYTPSFKSPTMAVFLVSDGGVTMSSILNPMMNIMNQNAPINQPGFQWPPVNDVPVSIPSSLLLLGMLLLTRKRLA